MVRHSQGLAPAGRTAPAVEPGWRLFCSHGAVLFYIARRRGCAVRDIADALVLTRRTVWGLVGDLRRAGLIQVRKEGRLHRYVINDQARFPDPYLSHLTVGQVFRALT